MEVGDREGEDIENWMAVSGTELGNTGTNTYTVSAEKIRPPCFL